MRAEQEATLALHLLADSSAGTSDPQRLDGGNRQADSTIELAVGVCGDDVADDLTTAHQRIRRAVRLGVRPAPTGQAPKHTPLDVPEGVAPDGRVREEAT